MKMKWIKIEDKVPPEGVNLLYFFDCTGISFGQYYGIEPDYCPETGHVFASHDGWLTGDVTHWMPLPDVPEGAYEEGWEMVEVEEEMSDEQALSESTGGRTEMTQEQLDAVRDSSFPK